MIRKPADWENINEIGDTPEKLPLGAYVCKIKQAVTRGDQLNVLFDIAEGPYKDYYAKLFRQDKERFGGGAKWKGVLRLWEPKDDGSDGDMLTKRIFKGFVTALEDSSPGGWRWNWTEEALTGHTIGIAYRNEEYDYNGYHGWSVRPFRALCADRVRNEDYVLPNDKPLARAASVGAQAATSYGVVAEPDEDLPF